MTDGMTQKQVREAIKKASRVFMWCNATYDDGFNFQISKKQIIEWLNTFEQKDIIIRASIADGDVFIG